MEIFALLVVLLIGVVFGFGFLFGMLYERCRWNELIYDGILPSPIEVQRETIDQHRRRKDA